MILDRLLDACWQGLAAFLAVGLLIICLRRMSPNMRGWLWRLCGLKMLISLIVILGVPLLPTEALPDAEAYLPPPPLLAQEATPSMAVPSTVQIEWPAVLLGIWATGFAVLLAHRLYAEIAGRAKYLRGENIASGDISLASDIAKKLGLRRAPAIRISEIISSPFVSGIWKPIVVLPRPILESPQELEVALAHEMAHIRRKDLAWQAFLAFVATVFWFFPPAYLAYRFAKGEAEMACDRIVLDVTESSPAQYSRLLVRLASQNSPSPATAAMAARSRYHLERRILAMDSRPNRLSRLSFLLVIAAVTPAIVPWNAIAQEPAAKTVPSKRLDELAMLWWGSGGSLSELNLSADQLRRLDEQSTRAEQEFRTFANKLGDLKAKNVSDKERLAYDNSIRMPMFQRHHRERWEILTPAQQQRMRELVCQYQGPMILSNADVAKLVGLPEKSRSSIAKIADDYNTFMKNQNRAHWLEFSKRVGGREIKIREFTAEEKRRMKEIEKLRFTASGEDRNKLQKEFDEIRQRGIRYENHDFQRKSAEARAWNLKFADRLMDERRVEFARLSNKALALVPASSLAKWKIIQGKPYAFKPLPKGQAAFSYR